MSDYRTEPITDKDNPLYGKAKRVIMPDGYWESVKASINKRMSKVHRDYLRKARQSEIDASKVVITD